MAKVSLLCSTSLCNNGTLFSIIFANIKNIVQPFKPDYKWRSRMFFRDTLPLLVCCMVIYLKYVNKSRDQCIGCLSLVVIMEGGGGGGGRHCLLANAKYRVQVRIEEG